MLILQNNEKSLLQNYKHQTAQVILAAIANPHIFEEFDSSNLNPPTMIEYRNNPYIGANYGGKIANSNW